MPRGMKTEKFWFLYPPLLLAWQPWHILGGFRTREYPVVAKDENQEWDIHVPVPCPLEKQSSPALWHKPVLSNSLLNP